MDYPKSEPGVGLVNNEFVDEDEVSGAQGSLIPAKWGNDVTKEILGVLAEAGIEPDEANPAQLRAAVVAIVDKVAPVATKAEAETNDEATANNVKRMTPLRVLQAIKARLINATETVVGMLRVGTQAEVDAGALDSAAVTPKKLRWGFAANFASNGYIIFPSWLGGLIFQWGEGVVNTSVDSTQSVTFPIAFPAACYRVIAGTEATGASDDAFYVLTAKTLNSASFKHEASNSSAHYVKPTYLAIGR